MNGYRFTLTCPDDGEAMSLRRGTVHEPDHTAAVARCKSCGVEWDIDVTARRRPRKRSRIARVAERIDAAAESATLAPKL